MELVVFSSDYYIVCLPLGCTLREVNLSQIQLHLWAEGKHRALF